MITATVTPHATLGYYQVRLTASDLEALGHPTRVMIEAPEDDVISADIDRDDQGAYALLRCHTLDGPVTVRLPQPYSTAPGGQRDSHWTTPQVNTPGAVNLSINLEDCR